MVVLETGAGGFFIDRQDGTVAVGVDTGAHLGLIMQCVFNRMVYRIHSKMKIFTRFERSSWIDFQLSRWQYKINTPFSRSQRSIPMRSLQDNFQNYIHYQTSRPYPFLQFCLLR